MRGSIRTLTLALGLCGALSAPTVLAQEQPGNLDEAAAWCARQIENEAIARQVVSGCGFALNRSDGDRALPLFRRGQAYAYLNDPAAALRDLDAAIRLEGLSRLQQQIAFLRRGGVNIQLGNYGDGVSDLSRAIDSGQLSGLAVRLALAIRSDAHGAMGNYGDAIADADEAAFYGVDANVHNQRCWWRAVANRQLDTAWAACHHALDMAEDDRMRSNVLDSRGLVNLRRERWTEAWIEYHAALRLRPDFPHALYGRGIAALRLGNTAEGRADIARALTLDPDIARTYADMGLRP